MDEIKVNLDNLTQEEREILMSLVKKGNEEKFEIKYPKDGTKYYYINDQGDILNINFIASYFFNRYNFEHNNFFSTYEEAEFEQEKQKVLFELKYWSDYNGNHEYNIYYYHIHYHCITDDFIILESCNIKELCNIYFSSREKAENAIKQVGEDRIKKYLFGVED